MINTVINGVSSKGQSTHFTKRPGRLWVSQWSLRTLSVHIGGVEWLMRSLFFAEGRPEMSACAWSLLLVFLTEQFTADGSAAVFSCPSEGYCLTKLPPYSPFVLPPPLAFIAPLPVSPTHLLLDWNECFPCICRIPLLSAWRQQQ